LHDLCSQGKYNVLLYGKGVHVESFPGTYYTCVRVVQQTRKEMNAR
jgi:hypothetical protein